MKLSRTTLQFVLLVPISLSAGGRLQTREILESFDADDHEIVVKLWTDDAHFRTVKAYPLSVERNLHSFWGSLLAASDGRLYLPPATHSDLGASIGITRSGLATISAVSSSTILWRTISSTQGSRCRKTTPCGFTSWDADPPTAKSSARRLPDGCSNSILSAKRWSNSEP